MRSRSLFSLIVLFSALFLLTVVWWFTKQKYTSHSVPITDLLQEKTRQYRPSPTFTLPTYLPQINDSQYIKDIDMQPFKSWRQGVVTLLEPETPRNCTALFNGQANQTEINKITKNWNSSSYDWKFTKLFLDSEDCDNIREEFSGNFYVSDEELSFPLAFSMNIHADPQQIVRFLKFIYHPHNVYCIHYDQKSSSAVKKVFNTLAKCLKNVIIPKKIVSIIYGCYHILEAQLSCMSDLLELRGEFPWKYVTTLCGKELPLRTNREIVRFLRGMKGLPVIYTSEFSSQEYSLKLHHTVINRKRTRCRATRRFQSKPVPYGMKLLKTMAYFSLTPKFTYFVVHSSEAKALYEFVKPISGPEEAFYGTLLHYWVNRTDENLHLPQIHVADTIWLSLDDKEWQRHCSGSKVHSVCIVSSGDLHRLKYDTDPDHIRPPLFHNKYSMAEDHTVIDCMEELLVERNKQEYVRDAQHVASYGKGLVRTVSINFNATFDQKDHH